MKLFKVTYKKMCHPSKGMYFEDHQAHYLSDSLDRLYDYIENEQHLTVISIEIVNYQTVPRKTTNLKLKSKTLKNHHGLSSYKDMINLLNENLSNEDLDQTITFYNKKEDEYYPMTMELLEVESADVLDAGHKVLILNQLGE